MNDIQTNDLESLTHEPRHRKDFVFTYQAYLFCLFLLQRKCKAVPLQAWTGPEGSRKLRFPDFVTPAQDDGMVVSHTHRPPLPPGNTTGIYFCERLSRTQGHSAIGRNLCQ